jgi:hypothetical protein
MSLLTAKIDRLELAAVLQKAEKLIETEIENIKIGHEAEIKHIMETKKTFFGRPFNRHKAEKLFRKIMRRKYAWQQTPLSTAYSKQYEIADIRELVVSAKLTNIRLSADALYILKEYF